MRTLISILALAVLFVALMDQPVRADDVQTEYYIAVGDYFGIPYEQVSELVQSGLSDEELPVACLIATRSGSTTLEVAAIRRQGATWDDVVMMFEMSAVDFYMIVTKTADSKVYGPIFNIYKETIEAKWRQVSLTDNELINLANLRFVSSHHDYSVFEVMAMRDYGKSFPKINAQVRLEKQRLLQKEIAKVTTEE